MAKKQEKRREASYYIDFENVRGAGLDGVEDLRKGDYVVVLYGSRDSALKIEQVQHVLDSEAKVEFIKVATGKHDALDFQLVALMFMNMKKSRDYFIISKDTGFDFAIRMAKERGMEHVYRRECISGATLEPKKLPQPRRRKQAKRLPQPQQQQAATPMEAGRDEQPADQHDQHGEAAEAPQERRRRGRRGQSQAARQQAGGSPAPEAQEKEPEREQEQPQAAAHETDQGHAAARSPKRRNRNHEPAAPEVEAPRPADTAEHGESPKDRPVHGEQGGQAEQDGQREPESQAEQPSPAPKRRRRRSPQAQRDPYRAAVEKVLAKHLGGLPQSKRVDAVLAGLERCETKSQFYNFLRGNMGNEQGREFYREVKGCFEELRAIERPAPQDAPENPQDEASDRTSGE